MIPTTADDLQHEFYVANILSVWHRATEDQKTRGRNWYPTAHQLAVMLSDGNPRAGAGVIAALSANKSWGQNVKLAARAFQGGPSGHTGAVLAKVVRIMGGEDPADVLPMTMKTGMFFRSIADPADPDAVVIDRHAHDIAAGQVYGNEERGLSNANRYATLAHAYREAARRLGELPLVVQATTWVVQVESLAGVGTRSK